jgi:hypothetical protein
MSYWGGCRGSKLKTREGSHGLANEMPFTVIELVLRELSTIKAKDYRILIPNLFFKDGWRTDEISASWPHILSQASPAPQSRHLPLHPRVDIYHIPQSEGGATAGGKADHAREEEYGG